LKNHGFTLIETLLIIVVVSIALPTLLMILGQSVKQRVRAELEITATQVAQAMMEEIKSKKWDENSPIVPGMYTTTLGPEAGETRPACTGSPSPVNFFDDVDDYHDYPETCIWNGAGYETKVKVCYVDRADLNTCLVPTIYSECTDYKRIMVTVKNGTLGAFSLVTVVTNY
jgi:Tfp pilus assembly major pilin PilA